MKTFRITYRTEVYIEAETATDAMVVFENSDLEDLDRGFVEMDTIEEIENAL